MSWHEVIDERSYDMHQVIADILRRNPVQLNVALVWIEKLRSDPEYSVQSKDTLTEWRDLIQSRGVEGVLAVLADHGEKATQLRHSSPFALLMPQDKRMEILRRYEARRPRAHPAGV